MILKIIEEKNKYNKEKKKNNLDIDKFSYRVICKDNKLYLVNANGYNCNITINNVRVSRGYRNNDYNVSTSVATPVSTGDIIKSSTKVAQPYSEITFVPLKA